MSDPVMESLEIILNIGILNVGILNPFRKSTPLTENISHHQPQLLQFPWKHDERILHPSPQLTYPPN